MDPGLVVVLLVVADSAILEDVTVSTERRVGIGRTVASIAVPISPMRGSFRQPDRNSSSNVAYAGQASKISDQGNWRERNGAVSITTSFGKNGV